eukprot:m.381173 g.381173  ORF g.381173 m.381173 type:complete len:59 (-) comp110289_c0_seq1:69-245(-)
MRRSTTEEVQETSETVKGKLTRRVTHMHLTANEPSTRPWMQRHTAQNVHDIHDAQPGP